MIKIKDYIDNGLEVFTLLLSAVAPFILSDEGAKTMLQLFYDRHNDSFVTKVELFQEQWSTKLIVFWILYLVLYAIYKFYHKKNISKLEENVKKKDDIIANQKKYLAEYSTLKQNLDLIFKHHLISIYQSLSCTASERISLYIVKDNQFIRCARYSQNPTYNKPGRSSYPLNQGVIGKAWERSIFFVLSLPDPKKNFKEYASESKKKFEISEREIKAFNMVSRSYLGYRISNKDESEYNGIIIVESTKPRFRTQKDITEVLSRNKECLFKLIRDFKDSIPTSHEELELLVKGGE